MKTEQDWVKEWREDFSLNRWRYDELELEKRIKQIQADAQKHGEQIGWYRGMTDATKLPLAINSVESEMCRDAIIHDRQRMRRAILTARDNKKEI